MAFRFKEAHTEDFSASRLSRTVEWRAQATAKWPKKKRKAALDGDEDEKPRFHLLDNRDDALAEQPPHFKHWPLRKEQLRSLKWMQWCEEESRPFNLISHQWQFSFREACSLEAGFHTKVAHGLDFPWQCNVRHREVYDVPGGILGDAVGYGKTATTIGLIASSRGLRQGRRMPAMERPSFWESNATLILVPSNLLLQWLGEFSKFLSDKPLRILAIKTARDLKALSVGRIREDADVVLCSYRLLYSPVYRRRLLELSGNHAAAAASDTALKQQTSDVTQLRSNTRRFIQSPLEVGWKHCVDMLRPDDGAAKRQKEEPVTNPDSLRFPVLEQFWWRRVVFDEFHELEAMGDSVEFMSLQNLCGSCRWGLTGTPPTRDVHQVATLAQLFHINSLPVPCISDVRDFFTDEALPQKMAQAFLDHFARQNTSTEVLPVAMREHIVEIQQTPEERVLYLQALHDMGMAVDGAALGQGLPAGLGVPLATQRLLRLCSHFGGGAEGAAGDAGGECRRLLGVKAKTLEKAKHKLAEAAVRLELCLRLSDTLADPAAVPEVTLEERREQLTEVLRRRLASPGGGGGVAGDDGGVAAAAVPSEAANGSMAAVADTPGIATAEASAAAPVAGGSLLDAVLDALALARRASDAELHRRVQAAGERGHGTVGLLLALLAAASPAAGPGATDAARALAPRSLQEAQKSFEGAADALAAARRSEGFFAKVLAAVRGEGSEEHRICSICLDEDIPCEQLSITACAHVFHSDCIREVVGKFKHCPECRHSLDVARDVTPLVCELAAADQAASAASSCGPAEPRGAKRQRGGGPAAAAGAASDAEFKQLAQAAGSKLAAVAVRLREIIASGEKAIVFCQWEELKRKVSSALQALGIEHFQLVGSVHQRGEVIRRFQEECGEGSTSVMLLSLENSASGTNLTAANHVVFVHPMCAASSERAVAYEAQAIGRCRRWGQERPEVHCWRFVTRGTVEEQITATHRKELWEHHHRGAEGGARGPVP